MTLSCFDRIGAEAAVGNSFAASQPFDLGDSSYRTQMSAFIGVETEAKTIAAGAHYSFLKSGSIEIKSAGSGPVRLRSLLPEARVAAHCCW
jgi:hypothetical protein